MAVVTGHIESLALDVGRVHDFPGMIGLGDFGPWRIFGLFGDRLDGGWSVDRLGDTDPVICQLQWTTTGVASVPTFV